MRGPLNIKVGMIGTISQGFLYVVIGDQDGKARRASILNPFC